MEQLYWQYRYKEIKEGIYLWNNNEHFVYAASVRKEIADETDRITGKTKQISNIPIHLSIYSPNGSYQINIFLRWKPHASIKKHFPTTHALYSKEERQWISFLFFFLDFVARLLYDIL